MMFLRIILTGCLLFNASSPLHTTALRWQVPFFNDSALDDTSKSVQWWGLCGCAAIIGFVSYHCCTFLAASVREQLFGSEEHSMTENDLYLFKKLLDCAERDMQCLRSGSLRRFEMMKIDLEEMSDFYEAEAECMRNQFVQYAATYHEDESSHLALEALYAQWHGAVERACIAAKQRFTQMHSA